MREIKFRAWDGKVMLYGVETLHYPIAEYRTSELMQFTGLLDKNGNPIYEGDVVENVIHAIKKVDAEQSTTAVAYTQGVDIRIRSEIVFSKETASFARRDYAPLFPIGEAVTHIGGKAITSFDRNKTIPLHGINFWEVIGNVYENPNLLAVNQ